jgi:tetratricopeptide (TPR) repeat protein
MSNGIEITRAAAAALVTLTFIAAGCGTDEESVSTTTSKPESRLTPPAQVVETVTPAPEVATTPAPAITDVTYEQSETAFLEGRYDEAVELFTAYTQRRESNPWGHYMLGMSAWKSGRLETAEASFKRAVELDSTLVKANLNLGRVLIEASRPSEALATIDRAIAVEGETSVAYRLKGNAYHTLGQNEDALASYRRAIQIDPEDAWSMNNLAFILIEEGRYDEALPALARATELRKDVAVFFNNLGMALERTGYFRAAEGAYTLASSLDGVSAKSVANRDRVAAVVEQPGTPPVDLAALARAFESEIGGSQASVATANVEATPATSAQSEADTTSSAQQPR